MMIDLGLVLVWALAVVGVTYTSTASAVFAPLRLRVLRLLKPADVMIEVFLYCPRCQSFWLGMILALVLGLEPRTWVVLWGFVAVGVTVACGPLADAAGAAYALETRMARGEPYGEQHGHDEDNDK